MSDFLPPSRASNLLENPSMISQTHNSCHRVHDRAHPHYTLQEHWSFLPLISVLQKGSANNANVPPMTGLATNVGPFCGYPPVSASYRSVMARFVVVFPIQFASLLISSSLVSGPATAAANIIQSDLVQVWRVSSGTAYFSAMLW